MDTTEKPRRPWRRRKRTWAAVAALLIAAYPASVGPAFYAAGRGWISVGAAYRYAGPIERLLPRFGPLEPSTSLSIFATFPPPNPRTRWFWDYVGWWETLGHRRRLAAAD